MSVFKGSITEYPGVIVDHFTPFNCDRGRAFFLSHCHKDHMTGLNSPQIVDALQRRNARLFCSEVTCSLLLQDPGFTQLAPFLKGLPMEEPVAMNLEPSIDLPALNFTITLLPAGHCPGSSMFFYQGSNGSVLYTGDFRLTLEETKKLKSLHCGGRLLEIKSLYLDTTFCHPIATSIPSREISRGHILEIAESWLSKSKSNVLHLQLGMFGYEHIYLALARRFNTKIHIARWRFNAYQKLPAVVECLTTDGESTRIHACNFRKGVRQCIGVPCGSRCSQGCPPHVLSIKPSTLWFLGNSGSLTEPYRYIPESNAYRVLHSMHASYTELCDFITYLCPSRIVPCVVPLGDRSLADVNIRLRDLLPHVEVVTETQTLTDQQHSNEKPTVSNDACKSPSKDLEECSNDTIDEFASGEEQQPHKTFSTKSTPRLFNLPSMLTNQSESSMLYESEQCHIPTSVSSSGSATLGSLEQTPIDLSPECTPVELDTTLTSAESGGDKEEADETTRFCIRCESPVQYIDEHSVPSTPEFKAKPVINHTTHNVMKEIIEKDGETLSNSISSDDDWHLTLESSTEEAKLSDSDETDRESIPPSLKRFKPDNTYSDHHEHWTTPTSTNSRRSRSLSVEIIEHRVIDFIDLTQDQSPDCSSIQEKLLEVSREGHLGVRVDDQQSVSPIEDRQSRSLSPFCLPPTPGRERVDSILERKSIAF